MPIIIGPIVQLQIHLGPLKVGEKGAKRYVTDPITVLERLRVSPDGVVGLHGGEEVLDAHHRAHTLRKNEDGMHGVSVGFTSHYRAMQQRFGEHMRVGCAGENLIVEASRRVEPAEVGAGFVILDSAGREKGRLVDLVVAHPCKPFTGFAHRDEAVPPGVFQESLQFLDGGTRGFYCTWAGQPAVLRLGDRLALA
uniref:MOSC domain-containing protein n=1 Tax=uncultured Gemmatimonadetes bacterium Rifle_16ft_4_minimus_7 TaxID=1665098 RepID=A0A0H4T9R3_9BACT|nr:hypothetical protein [uncultured Gemmatimonadetes bacterium Rifle_16ft_4_minimus_7]